MRCLAVLLALTPALAHAQVAYPPTDTEARAAAQAALDAATGAVKTVNGVTPGAGGNVVVPVPTASTSMPPSVSDTGTVGTATTVFALANHTHASKARKGRLLVSGTADVTFSSAFSAAPLCVVVAETTPGDTAVVNAQIDGPTTPTGFRIRITRTNQSVVALLGLTVLSVPTQIATNAHFVCLEP